MTAVEEAPRLTRTAPPPVPPQVADAALLAGAAVLVEDVRVHFDVTPDRSTRGLTARPGPAGRPGGRERVAALDGVDLCISRGESVGIIGRNGAGKSTLLRTMAGLQRPTSGRVHVREQPVLLGVSAALVPALSGARNIVLGALALGLTRREVRERFDSIVELSGLGAVIHRPMAGYSSGMQARLRFAVATCVTPDVLLVDEALNTGDEEFQEWSRARIEQLRETAGTVVVVSHSLITVQQLSTRMVWMHDGRPRVDGPPHKVARLYREHYREVKAARAEGREAPRLPWETGDVDQRLLARPIVAGAASPTAGRDR